VTAEELMTRDMVTVTPYESGETALRRMGLRHISHLPVVDPYDPTRLMGWLSKGDVVFAYEDYHRRMEAPVTDETVGTGTAEEGAQEEGGEKLEEVLAPLSFLDRVLGRKRKAVEVPTDVQPVGEEVEEVVVERDEPRGGRSQRDAPPGPVEDDGSGDGRPPASREVTPTAEEAGWEEEPASRGAPLPRETTSRFEQREWEESPATRSKKGPEPVEKVPKRRV
jgi:CBS domain-containing protein